MPRCPSCGFPLPSNRERAGARCPHCYRPLQEPPGRTPWPAREGEAACPVHTGSASVGTCARCGNYLCEVCRTRWRDQVLCVACVDRALETRETAPEQTRGHFRQAILGLLLGSIAWVITIAAFIGAAVVGVASGNETVLGLLVLAAIGPGILLAVLGLGQATAALRVRGNHMILATLGLLVSGLFVGVILGLFTFSVWQS